MSVILQGKIFYKETNKALITWEFDVEVICVSCDGPAILQHHNNLFDIFGAKFNTSVSIDINNYCRDHKYQTFSSIQLQTCTSSFLNYKPNLISSQNTLEIRTIPHAKARARI